MRSVVCSLPGAAARKVCLTAVAGFYTRWTLYRFQVAKNKRVRLHTQRVLDLVRLCIAFIPVDKRDRIRSRELFPWGIW